MEPIINPLFFYLIHLADNLRTTAGILIFIGLAIIIFSTTLWGMMDGFTKCTHTLIKTFIIVVCVSIVIVIFIPSQETCYQMFVASLATPDNLNWVVDTGKSIADYIVESAAEIVGAIGGK